MTFDPEKLLDDTGWQLLQALQADARLSFAELGRMVGLSPPAVAERVRRMEDAGIIMGYRAEVNPEKIGLPLTALIALTTTPQQYPQVIALINDLPEVLECHHVTGNGSFSIKAIASSISHLESLIEQLSRYGQTSTSIVLSRTKSHQAIQRL
ncbi:MAG TPA: Lrp/AsnC family transcriptional regulator [Coleofasciculaceae cyanobacterium]|jgi:Lrp/AsnC family leucine-responsive transcriptional regulator